MVPTRVGRHRQEVVHHRFVIDADFDDRSCLTVSQE